MATTYSGKSTRTVNGNTTEAPWPSNLPGGPTGIRSGVLPGQTVSVSASGTITVTLTWVPSGQNDPPPPTLWLYQNGNASASGDNSATADNGLGDPQTGNAQSISPPKSHLKKFDASSGKVVASCTLKATASTYVPSPLIDGSSVGANVSYSVSIRAQPYGMKRIGYRPYSNGVIEFTYDWKSTSGRKSDIDPRIKMYERVNYPGGNPYQPPYPFASSLNNPATGNSWSPRQSNVIDTHGVPQIYSPYADGSYTGTQNYYFDDDETKEKAVLLLGPFDIVRRVRPTSDGWYYTISKDGEVNSVPLP